MSEELKQDSINELWSEMFYAYREWSGRADANLPEDLPQAFAIFLLRRKYQLAQVCEQREKGSLGIVTVGDPILRKQCSLASGPQGGLLAKLWKVMDSAQAAGLAAPQIGVNARVAVVRADGYNLELVNPEILQREGSVTAEEGCLSIPDVTLKVTRAAKIQVRAKHDTFWAEGLVARAIQHEIDHLDGILITDRANERAEAAELALQKWVKAMDGRTPECAAEDLLNATATCSDLRATLQAKEQELVETKLNFKEAQRQSQLGWASVAKLKTKLAQARQQAIAEQAETVDILKRGLQNAVIYEEKRCYYRTANGVKMEIPKRYEMPIRVAMETIIRSLTPPPPSSASSEARSRTVETTGVSATSQQSATASQSGTRTICGNLLAAAFGNAIECNLRKGHSGLCKYTLPPALTKEK